MYSIIRRSIKVSPDESIPTIKANNASRNLVALGGFGPGVVGHPVIPFSNGLYQTSVKVA